MQHIGLKDFSVLFYLFLLPKVCELNSLLLSPDESYIPNPNFRPLELERIFRMTDIKD